MATAKKVQTIDQPGKPLQTIPLDEADLAFLEPLVDQINDARQAQRVVANYVQSIVRRSGVTGRPEIIIDAKSRTLILKPEKK